MNLFHSLKYIFLIQWIASFTFVYADEPYKKLKLDHLDVNLPELHLQTELGNIASIRRKPTVLHFWASWCSACKKELPLLIKLSEKSNQFEFMPVSIDEKKDRDKALRYLRELSKDLPFYQLLSEGNAKKNEKLWSWGLPITYFINAQGKVFARALGERNWALASKEDLETLFQIHLLTPSPVVH